MAEKKIRVLIVDDSASVRQALAKVLTEEGDIEIMAAAGDPFMAAKKLQEDVPDVITLDVEMPKMDGITFLRKLMSQHPIPVVMCSSLTESGSETLMQAMEAGAVDVILKPKIAAADFLAESGARIRQTIRAAAQARLGAMRKRSVGTGSSSNGPAAKLTADGRFAAAIRARDGEDDRNGLLHRGIHRRHGGAPRTAGSAARQYAGNRHCPAHAGKVHRRLCQAPQRTVRS